MATEKESLVLEVKSQGIDKANRSLDRLEKEARGADRAAGGLARASNGLGGAFTRLLVPLGGLVTAGAALNKTFRTTVDLQNFQARLKTATGSVEAAAVAFESLEEFASTTPFQLEQSLDAFIKLTNLGLNPSEKALASYGNTASAMGKDLNQLIEAVADATTGEFERLKEFGIKAKSEGDRVSFTFRGITKTIGKNAAEIEKYLQDLGENEFAGAMADQMDTLGGKVSNLEDKWNQLFRTISEAGVGDVLEDSVQVGIDLIEELIVLLESGQLEASIQSWTAAFEDWAEDFDSTIEFVSKIFGSATDYWEKEGTGVWETIITTLKQLPATVRYWMNRVGVEVSILAMHAGAVGTAFVETFVAKFQELVELAKVYGKAIATALNPFDDTDFKQSFAQALEGQAAVSEATAARISKSFEEAGERIELVRQARIDALETIALEFGETADRIDELTDKAKNLRREFEMEKELDKFFADIDGDRTAKFKIRPEVQTDPTQGTLEAEAAGQKEFDRLLEQLQSEEAAIENSYLNRLELVRRNTEEGSLLRESLEMQLRNQYERELSDYADRQFREVDYLRQGFQLQISEVEAFYDKKRLTIERAGELTAEAEIRIEEEKNRQINAMQRNRMLQGLDYAENMFAGYAMLARSSNEEVAKIGRKAFELQKAASIASTTIKTYESATSAYASAASIPVIGHVLAPIAAGAAIAAGIANVAAISQQTYAGGYASGGIIPGQSFQGDNMTANVNSGEMVLNFAQQRRLFELANGGRQSTGGGNVTIINQTRTPVEAEQRTTATGEKEIIIKEAVAATKAALTREAVFGGGEFVPALANSHGLRRVGT